MGTDVWINGSLTLHYVAHELGHTFGLSHAKSMSCTADGVRVTIAADLESCSVGEYGDPFDTMGTGTRRHINNVAKSGLGWIDPAAVTTVSGSGVYSLAPAEGAFGTLPQLLRIRRLDGSWLGLEFRQPYGQYFDTFSSSEPVTNGVTIRLTSSSWAGTRILDTTPETLTFWDAPLTLDKAFDDPAGGVSITTTAVSATAATVQITISGVPDTHAPSAPGALTATATADGTVALAWTPAGDDVGVEAYRVLRNGTLLTTLSADVLRYSDGGMAAGRTYTYSVAAVDAAGNVGAQISASATIFDTAAPTAPQKLAAIAKGRKVTLSWSVATDNVGVAGYRVYRNGTVSGTANSTTYSDSLSGKSRTSYYIVAFDAAGNVSPASNTITVG